MSFDPTPSRPILLLKLIVLFAGFGALVVGVWKGLEWLGPVITCALSAVLILLTIVFERRKWLRQRADERAHAGLCAECGYDLRQSFDRCPECGADIPPPLARRRRWRDDIQADQSQRSRDA